MTNCCHLHVHSRYSFKDGLDYVDELVRGAVDLGQPGIALTDHGVLYGAPDLFKEVKKLHEEGTAFKGVIGMEAYEAVPHEFDMERDGAVFKIKWADLDGRDRYFHLTLWVLDLDGWINLCALHSLSFSGEYYPSQRSKPLIDRASLERHNAGLAVGLGCPASKTSRTIARSNDPDDHYRTAKWYADVFQGRCYMELMANLPEQIGALRAQRKLATRLGIPCVADNDVHYLRREDGREHGPHHLLVQSRAFAKADIEKSGDKSDAGFGEWYGTDGFYLKSAQQMLDGGNLTVDEVERSLEILDRVDFDFASLPEPQPPIPIVPEPGEDTGFDAYLNTYTEDDWAAVLPQADT